LSVLILSGPGDEHVPPVAEQIRGLGGAVETVDLSLFPEESSLTMRYDCCNGAHSSVFEFADRRLPLQEVGSVWWRRPQPPVISEAVVRPSHRQFAENECQEALHGLWQSLDVQWMNEPLRDLAAQRKPYQLRVAQQVGLTILRTLITNDPDQALRFVDANGYRDVVYKAFSATVVEWRETRLLRPEELKLLERVRHAPVIFQKYVPARYDLRITIVGERIFAAAIYSQETAYPVDSRIDIANAAITATQLPDELEAKLRALMARLGLAYGAIDMRLRPDGTYVFLEINPAGQWMYIEAATGQPIAQAVAQQLHESDRTQTGRTDRRRRGSLSEVSAA
jgi:glutathione synthase/RimK-type ligase-like ATP-grasp enzyme